MSYKILVSKNKGCKYFPVFATTRICEFSGYHFILSKFNGFPKNMKLNCDYDVTDIFQNLLGVDLGFDFVEWKIPILNEKCCVVGYIKILKIQ